MSELIRMTASELAGSIRERHVSSVEVVEAHLRRIDEANPTLNAIVNLDADGALQQARVVDARISESGPGDSLPPLLGVPITLKDCHEVAGMPTTAGHPPLADYMPAVDGTVAARMRAAGAIVMGRTNVSELLGYAQSYNDVFGQTNNPWNIERTPGGSSGGAAAAVASMMSPLDIGSDIGGSIRIPSHFCGIVGLKPTQHRVSNHGHIPDLPDQPRLTRVMNSIGPMARSIDDLALGFSIIAGADGNDLDVPPLPLRPVPDLSLHSLRIAWASEFPGTPPAREVRTAVEQFAGKLQGEVAALENTLPDISFEEQLATRARLREMVGMSILDSSDNSRQALDYLTVLDARDRFTRAWEHFFQSWDVLLCPVTMTTAFPHCENGTAIQVDGVATDHGLAIGAYVRPFNLTGHPVVVIPIGFDSNDLPIGIQIVSARWKDEELLGAAKALSEVAQPFRWPNEGESTR